MEARSRIDTGASPSRERAISPRRGGGKRGRVTRFSNASRNRLLKCLHSVDWSHVAPQGGLFIGLTYPGNARFVPTDGNTVQAHLRALRMRWERRFGDLRAVWKLEYQARGAPHLHLLVVWPEGEEDDEGVRSWARHNWWKVVGSGDQDHLVYGAYVDVWADPAVPIGYLTGLSNAHPDWKRQQHTPPEGFENTGRWWGHWRLNPDHQTARVTEETFHSIRRTGRRAYKAARGKPLRCRTAPYAGLWVALDGSAAVWANRVLGRRVFAEPSDPDGDPSLSRADLPDSPWVSSEASAIDVEDISE